MDDDTEYLAGLEAYLGELPPTPRTQQHPRQHEEQLEGQGEQREDRERRSATERPGSPRAGVVHAVGGKVIHDLLGEAIVRKLSRPDDPEGKINIEWSRPGKRKPKRDPLILQNRWVLPASLRKLWTSPRHAEQSAHAEQSGHEPTAPEQQGLFGAMPDLAAHERERAAKVKGPEGLRGRQHSARQTKESKVLITQRLREFPNQGLIESAGQLFCPPCKETIPNIKSSIEYHIRRQKRKTNLMKHRETNGDDAEIKELLSNHFTVNPDKTGTRTSAEVHVYRYRVIEKCMQSGTPLERIDMHRPLLERTGMALTASQNLRQTYIPRIEERQLDLFRADTRGQFLGVHFDGTTRLGEAICLTGRWCTSDFKLHIRLLQFKTTATHVSAPQLASLITGSLGSLGIQPGMVVNISRDSASTNGAACRLMLGNPLINAADTLCISHTISNAGARIDFPTLAEFTTPWLELVGGRDPHAGAKALWKNMVAPQVVPGYSKVRWWSKAEIWFVMAENFNKLMPLLRLLRDRDIGDATTASMTSILRDREAALQLELAGILDVRVLVRTTYELEGDRLEVLLVFRRIEELRAIGRSLSANEDGVLPNVDAALRARAELKNGLEISK